MKPSVLIYGLLVISVLFTTCKKSDTNASSETNFTAYSLGITNENIKLLEGPQIISITVPESITSGAGLVANFNLSEGARAQVNNVPQQSGVTQNNFEHDLLYTVTAANKNISERWIIAAANNEYSMPWGLGHFIKKTKSNDRSYEWYIDQAHTGTYSYTNCGPTSVTMAIKWADSTFTKTPEDARAKYHPDILWWDTDDIQHYLADFEIPHTLIQIKESPTESTDLYMKLLDSGLIIISCIDMHYISEPVNTTFRTNKFYKTTPRWGHFFIIKGYVKVDEQIYFQVYDPFSIDQTNEDNTLKGRNRFYSDVDVFSASANWWPFAIIVGKKNEPFDALRLQQQYLRTTKIPVKGRF
jgi:hypothetical protein